MTVSVGDICIWHFQYPVAVNLPWLNVFMKFPDQTERVTEQSSEFCNGLNICATCFTASAGYSLSVPLSHTYAYTEINP